MRSHSRHLALAVLLLSACDVESPTEARHTAADVAQDAVVSERYVTVPQYSVELRLPNQIRLGQTFTVNAVLRGLRNVGAVDMTISAPEVVTSRANGVRPADFRIDAMRANVRATGVHERRATLRIDVPGYYRVVATAATAGPLASPFRNTETVEDFAYEELWILVDERGSTITQRFDAELLPDSVIPQPGPFRPATWAAPTPSGDGLASASMLGVRTWTVEYYNTETATYDPLPFVKVIGTEGGPSGQTPVNTTTNFNGEFTTSCDELGFYSYDLEVLADHALIEVTPSSEVGSFFGSGPGCGDETIVTLSDESHLFHEMHTGIANASNAFADGRSQVSVKLDTASSAWSSYSRTLDLITIASDSHLWGDLGRSTMAHEYGHAYHEVGLGGLPLTLSCSFHAPGIYTDLHCALSEGFAAYVSLVARPEVFSGSTVSLFESNAYIDDNANPDSSDPNDPNGSILEGAVTAFLWDVTDAANETHDDVAYPHSYVADILRTCEVGDGTTVLHADGIDHAIRCFEKQVDNTINSYFYTRDPASTTYSESATEPGSWNLNDIRQLWLKDLYDQ